MKKDSKIKKAAKPKAPAKLKKTVKAAPKKGVSEKESLQREYIRLTQLAKEEIRAALDNQKTPELKDFAKANSIHLTDGDKKERAKIIKKIAQSIEKSNVRL